MGHGLIVADDQRVSAWAFANYKLFPMPVDRALGIINTNSGELVGAVLLQNYNGANIELSYYGKGTLTAGIVKSIARLVVLDFNAARVTAVTSKKNRRLMRTLQRFGFRLEGSQRCYFGHRDCYRNTGIRFVMFREKIERIVGVTGDSLIQKQG